MPEIKTVADRLYADNGKLWVKTNEKKIINDKTFTAYDVFSETGIYEAKIWLDFEPGEVSFFRNGKFYELHVDKETGAVAKRYNVIWSDQ